MKNFIKAFGLVAMVAVIWFSVAGCGGGGDGGGGDGGIGSRLLGLWKSDTEEMYLYFYDLRTEMGGTWIEAYHGDTAEIVGGYTGSGGSAEINGNRVELIDHTSFRVAFEGAKLRVSDYQDSYEYSSTNLDGLYSKHSYNSSNYLTWTTILNNPFVTGTSPNGGWEGDIINAIAYGNGTFVAVGGDGKIATSTTGATWTAVTDSTFGTDDPYNAINAIAYGSGKFVAGFGGGKIAYADW